MKSPPELPSAKEVDRPAEAPGYYSRAEKGRRTRFRMTEEEIRATEQVNWAARRCKKALQVLEGNEYIRRPFEPRAEYVTLLTALMRSLEYACQMARRHKGASVETILRRATTPENIEYLLNGSTFLASKFPGASGFHP